MKYTLMPEHIDIEIQKKEKNCLGYNMPPITKYQAIAKYKYSTRYNKYEITSESDFHTNKEDSVKEAVKKLEWDVYYHKIRHNSHNESKEF